MFVLHIIEGNFHMHAEDTDYVIIAEVTIYIMTTFHRCTSSHVMYITLYIVHCMLNHPH